MKSQRGQGHMMRKSPVSIVITKLEMHELDAAISYIFWNAHQIQFVKDRSRGWRKVTNHGERPASLCPSGTTSFYCHQWWVILIYRM